MRIVEVVDTMSLMLDNIRHVCVEIKRSDPNCFRIAKEADNLFHRAMIEVLKGTNNGFLIKPENHNKNKPHQYQHSNQPWQQVRRIPPQNGKRFWRYSDPELCPAPQPEEDVGREFLINGELKGFDELLAMVQSEAFMCIYYGGRPIVLRDSEMTILEKNHNNVRNEFEHFLPKAYLLTKRELLEASLLCINLSHHLLFNSNPYMRARHPPTFARLLDAVSLALIEKVRRLPGIS